MTTHPGRNIDPELFTVSSGLFDTLPPPAPFALLRDSLAPLMAAESCARVEDRAAPLRLGQLLGAGAGVALMMFASALQYVTAHALAPAAPAAAVAHVAPVVAPAPVSEPAPVVDEAPAPIAAAPVALAAAPRKAFVAAPRIAAAHAEQAPPDDLAVASIAAARPARDVDPAEAGRAVAAAARSARGCTEANDARSTMSVSVTFAPSGRVTTARITGGPFLGTEVGGCIARSLRGASVEPFSGAPVTVNASVSVR